MKLSFLVLSILFSAAAAFADAKAPGCHIYGPHVVFLTDNPKTNGQDIEIRRRSLRETRDKACKDKTLPVQYVLKDYKGAWFWDVYQDFLVLDIIGDGPREVAVWDLAGGKSIYRGSAEDLKFTSAGVLGWQEQLDTFSKTHDSCLAKFMEAWQAVKTKMKPKFDAFKTPDCSKCKDWEETNSTGFDADVEFDLSAREKRYTGTVKCVMRVNSETLKQ